ncbi:hypothetical protein SAMN05216436_10553 [bacterium A37T11]|nr:hypothetical protein SAMN05216436_10553 [bacterium A37T11]
MKYKIRYFLMILGVCSLCGCFDIVEEINLAADGSGQMIVTLNLSQSRSKVASVLLLDSVNGYKIPKPAEIRNHLEQLASRLGKMPGISQVNYTSDFTNYIANIRFSFASVTSLNQISQVIFKELKIPHTDATSYKFDAGAHIFSRNYAHMAQASASFNKLKAKDQALFKGAAYTSIYRFSVPVVSVSNKQAKISPSKKAVMLRTELLDLIQGNATINNRIQLAN